MPTVCSSSSHNSVLILFRGASGHSKTNTEKPTQQNLANSLMVIYQYISIYAINERHCAITACINAITVALVFYSVRGEGCVKGLCLECVACYRNFTGIVLYRILLWVLIMNGNAEKGSGCFVMIQP